MSGDWESRLGAYVDGELDPAEVRDIEQQIAADPRARERVRIYRETTALLRAACAEAFYTGFPDALRARIEKPWRGTPLRISLAVAAAILLLGLGFVGGWMLAATPASEAGGLVDEIAEYHGVYARETKHLVEVPASRSAELADWLGDRIGHRLTIPDLSPDGWSFAGGRMLVVDGRPVAQLLYVRPGETPLGVCITRSRDAEARMPVRMERRDDLDIAFWQANGYAFVIVGLQPGKTAPDLISRVAAALQGGAE